MSSAASTALRLASRGSSPLAIAARIAFALTRRVGQRRQREVADRQRDFLAMDLGEQPEHLGARGLNDEVQSGHDPVGDGVALFLAFAASAARWVKTLVIAISCLLDNGLDNAIRVQRRPQHVRPLADKWR